jgi:hypothetical protein
MVYLTSTYSDEDGHDDLKACRLHIGRWAAPKSLAGNAVLLYQARTNKLLIRNDRGTRWWGGKPVGSDNVIQNGQVKVYCNRTTVTRADNTIQVRWAVEFKPAFRGKAKMHLKARDLGGLTSALERKGTWTICSATRSFEWEHGSGDGRIMDRSNASNRKTVWLHPDEWRAVRFTTAAAGGANVRVRYSNDNAAGRPLELVTLTLGGDQVYSFRAQNTYAGGPLGSGWNNFRWTDWSAFVRLAPGQHQLKALVTGGDGYGVELDVVELCMGD